MGVRAVDPGVPRVEDRRDPRDRPQRPFPSSSEDESDEKTPSDLDTPPEQTDEEDSPDPERLVDIRVAPQRLPTRQLLPDAEHTSVFF